MRSFKAFLVPLALSQLASTTPLSTGHDSCIAAIFGGNSDRPDEAIRRTDCINYLKSSLDADTDEDNDVTDPSDGIHSSTSGWNNWRRGNSVSGTNGIPDYANVCDEDSYRDACSRWNNVGPSTTMNGDQSVKNGQSSSGASGQGEKDERPTKFPTTQNDPQQGNRRQCLDDTKAKYFADGFKELLEFTSYKGDQGPPGRGYHYETSAAILAEDFQDWSDSINWMAGLPLGTMTFANRTAFDYGQGVLQPELKVTTLNLWHSCDTITWRWNALAPSGASVTGINQMVLDTTLSKIKINYAEFNNAAWLSSFGLQCKVSKS